MKALAVLGAAFGIVIWMVVGTVVSGYVLSVLWGWFIVPTLRLPQLSIVPAIGIATVVSYLTYHEVDCQPKEEKAGYKVTKAVVLSFVRPLLALLFGWIVHCFM